MSAQTNEVSRIDEEFADLERERDRLLEWVEKFPTHSPETLWNLLQTETAKIAAQAEYIERLRGALENNIATLMHRGEANLAVENLDLLNSTPESLAKVAEEKQKVEYGRKNETPPHCEGVYCLCKECSAEREAK